MNARDPDHTEEKPVGVILVEDEPATQDHLIRVIESSPKVELLGTASNVQDAYSLLFMTNPKVALIDLGLPDSSGIEVIQWLSKHKPDTECLVITTFGDEDHVVRSLEAGASGYLLKDYSNNQLQNKTEQEDSQKSCNITDRELTVIQQVARGFTAQEIAAQMGISTHTVATHVKRIYKKLHVHSRSEAVYEANLLGLLDL